jgi:hypothetical protein
LPTQESCGSAGFEDGVEARPIHEDPSSQRAAPAAGRTNESRAQDLWASQEQVRSRVSLYSPDGTQRIPGAPPSILFPDSSLTHRKVNTNCGRAAPIAARCPMDQCKCMAPRTLGGEPAPARCREALQRWSGAQIPPDALHVVMVGPGASQTGGPVGSDEGGVRSPVVLTIPSLPGGTRL